jgi:hypothetical protein
MAKSRRESPLFSISFLPQEGGHGSYERVRRGEEDSAWPGQKSLTGSPRP